MKRKRIFDFTSRTVLLLQKNGFYERSRATSPCFESVCSHSDLTCRQCLIKKLGL